MNRIRLLFSTYYTQNKLFSIGSTQSKTTKTTTPTTTTTHTTHKKHYTHIYLLKQLKMKYETLVKHGIINGSDYQNTIKFMLKNNEQNDLNNKKTEGKYFYNIGCEEINDRLYFCFVYNRKNCYYDFIYKTLKITLSEDLKVEVAVELADLIKFLKDNNSLFEFNQSDYLQHEGDKSIFKTVLYIKH